jgi:hypothetical protein
MSKLMLAGSALLLVALAALAPAAASSAAESPKITATLTTLSPTSRLVWIVNHGRVTYREFVAQSVNRPRIIAATKPCVVQRDANFNGATSNWRYRATCRRALAPGKALKIGLTTSRGNGSIAVYVGVNGELVLISK